MDVNQPTGIDAKTRSVGAALRRGRGNPRRPLERCDRDVIVASYRFALQAGCAASGHSGDIDRRRAIRFHQFQFAKPGRVISVTDPAKKERRWPKSRATQKHIEQCPLFLVWLRGPVAQRLVWASRRRDARDHAAFRSLFGRRIDAALAAQNATVSGRVIGPFDGVYRAMFVMTPSRSGAFWACPRARWAVFGMCVGYPLADGDQ